MTGEIKILLINKCKYLIQEYLNNQNNNNL